MSIHPFWLLAALWGQGAGGAPGLGGVSSVAYGADGRLVAAIDGDIWVRQGGQGAHWIQITSGPAWDREPTWRPGTSFVLFASNRSETSNLWQIAVGDSGALGAPQPVTRSSEWEAEPTAAPDGEIAFVRGRGPAARIWVRHADGSEHRLTTASGVAERWPAFSPDGRRIAYAATSPRVSQLRVRWLDADTASVVVANRAAERPVWAPGGDRIAFVVRNGDEGVWVADADGQYVNLVSLARAAPAWAPDGATLTLVGLPPAEPAYNGDPDRLGERDVVADYPGSGGLMTVTAPQAPDAGMTRLSTPSADRRETNAARFDAMWERTARLYFAGPDASRRRARWEELGRMLRPRAIDAGSDEALAAVMHELWQRRPALRAPAAGRAGVSSAHPVATAAGLEMLARGGNVVDAAVAVSFALGVVEPDASGVGGYGQMLITVDHQASPALIEFMTRAPVEASLDNGSLQSRDGYPDDGPVLPNVPGTVAGMYLAWQKYGSHRIPWAELLAPAIRAAEQGFVVSDGLATTLSVERDHFLKYPGSRSLFFPHGEPLAAGDTLRNPDLGWTLRQIADSGAPAFYQGVIAQRLVTDLRGHGNAIRRRDLERYYAAEREPVSGTYRNYTVFSSAPPSAGGATLVAQLNLLEHLTTPKPYSEDAVTLHAMIEAWKLVPSGRGRIADPGLWPVSTAAFVSKDSALVRWACFDAHRVLTPGALRGTEASACGQSSTESTPELLRDAMRCANGGALAGGHCHQAGTTAFVVADADGNAVAATQTLGTWGGNFYVTPGLGFLYNDKLTSYGDDPAQYGARLPNARHGSSIAPTIVYRGTGADRRPVFAVGAAGNAWITAAVYSMVTGLIDQGLDPQRAIELPRFLVTQRRSADGSQFVVQLEDGVAPGVVRTLETLGHRLQFVSLKGELREGYAAAIAIGPRGIRAAADPRRAGTAGAIGCGSESAGCRLDEVR